MLEGKKIIVTGAASGIGAATAALLTQQGAEVIGVDIQRPAQFKGQFVQADLSRWQPVIRKNNITLD
jgi:NAD(P)-dependent dehydrogenase (short-subunit alcohol dehydrogenase family)